MFQKEAALFTTGPSVVKSCLISFGCDEILMRVSKFYNHNAVRAIPKAASAEKAALKSDLIYLGRIGKRRKTVLVYFAAFA